MGNPAASAEVQPSGRRALEPRSNPAEPKICQPAAGRYTWYSSQRWQASASSSSRWWSP